MNHVKPITSPLKIFNYYVDMQQHIVYNIYLEITFSFIKIELNNKY